jgi:predicted transcriptional regulator
VTRFIWDKFSKDFLETLLSPYGTVVVSKEVTSEIKEIDVYFSPNTAEIPPQLGLLGKLCQTPCLLEPYRNPITLDSLNDCLSKRFAIREIFQREAKRNKQRISEEEIPKLWIITPTASERILSLFTAQLQPNWGEGVYFLPQGLGTAIIVIHQLPETSETLWLRLLGRGGTRERAIDELERLSPNAPLKSASLNLLYNLSRNLEALSKKTQEDRQFIMRLAPLYQQDREQAVQEGLTRGLQQGVQQGIQQGRQQGEAKLVLRQLQRRFGEIPQNLEEIIRSLPVERLEDLGLALLDFDTLTDLDNWLHS